MLTTCGTCGFTWDDSVSTDRTPVPSARTPCEPWHKFNDNGEYTGLDYDTFDRDIAFVKAVRGGWY